MESERDLRTAVRVERGLNSQLVRSGFGHGGSRVELELALMLSDRVKKRNFANFLDEIFHRLVLKLDDGILLLRRCREVAVETPSVAGDAGAEDERVSLLESDCGLDDDLSHRV